MVRSGHFVLSYLKEKLKSIKVFFLMTFLDIFKTMKNNYPVFSDAFRNFTWLFFEEVREYGYVSLLKLSLSPDLRAIGFFNIIPRTIAIWLLV